MINLNLSLEELKKLSNHYNVIPLYAEVLVDTETPLSLFLKLYQKGKVNILLESAESQLNWGRYSFIVQSHSHHIKYRKGYCEVFRNGKVELFQTYDPFGVIKEELKHFRPYQDENLPRFWGGFVGYVSYDVIKLYEPIEDQKPDSLSLYDIYLVLTDLVVIHDNLSGKIKVVVPIFTDRDLEREYQRAKDSIYQTLKTIFASQVSPKHFQEREAELHMWQSNFKKEDFQRAVLKAKDYIYAGDIIQVVLSQRFRKDFKGSAQDLYRALRCINPSPYMYYLDYGFFQVVGSSPEVLVRLEDGIIETRPIAGTRKRGKTEEEDKKLREELLSDEKEKAEHLMLVDLARNDIGKVSQPGSVQVKEFMVVENYSHVMHIVSHVVGRLKEGFSHVDVLKATFPAGTVSGAPKIRAMQIIEELEPHRRGIYAGSVGYLSFQGNMDMAITIRTAVVVNQEVYVQAGAGIVADSDPEKEWLETVNKAKAIMKAVHMAENPQSF